VLDGMLDVVPRDVDRQANLVLRQLLHARSHAGIVAAWLWATGGTGFATPDVTVLDEWHRWVVAGHYQSIGVEDIRPFIEHALKHGGSRSIGDGYETIVFRDSSGASMVMWADAGKFVDGAPSFAATLRIAVAEPSLYLNESDRFSSVAYVEVLEGGEMNFPLTTALENVHELFDRPETNFTALALTGFAEEISVWPSEAAYDAVHTGQPQMASESFVPSGMFAESPQEISAHGFMTGIVEQVETRLNGVSGNAFVVALVRTYGMTLECVFAPQDAENIATGSVVQGTFWLMGRLLPA
jgi:hypothetical protein